MKVKLMLNIAGAMIGYGIVKVVRTVLDETALVETARFRVCSSEKVYGIQIPAMS